MIIQKYLHLFLGFISLFLFSCSHNQTVSSRQPATQATLEQAQAVCSIQLTLTGSSLYFKPEEMDQLNEFKEILNVVSPATEYAVHIRGITPNRKVTSQRATQIISDLINENSELSQDIRSQIANLGGLLQGSKIRNFYLTVYDKVVARANGYLFAFMMADKIFPKKGRFAFLAGGPGNDAAIEKMLGPDRYVISADSSEEATRLAKLKLNLLTKNDPSQFEVLQMDIKKDQFPSNSLDGVMLHYGLYPITERKEKIDDLEVTYDAVKPGAFVIFADPSDIIKQDKPKLKKFMTDVAMGAVYNNSPMNEYELAMVAGINIQILMKQAGIFSTPQDLMAMATDAGFKIVGRYTNYYGGTTYLVLQKPY
jgi:ubiquinone/menaquinone biosynthesis C-methylase UbiE